MKEVPGVVPDEPGVLDRPAIAARLVGGLEHDDALLGVQLAPPVREPQARDAGADHHDVGLVVRHRRASSLLKIRRAIAIAQP